MGSSQRVFDRLEERKFFKGVFEQKTEKAKCDQSRGKKEDQGMFPPHFPPRTVR